MCRPALALLLPAFALSLPASDIPPPRSVDVAAIVRQLGSEDFAEREAASARLAALPVDEPPAELLAALKSSNPEVRNRAARVLKDMQDYRAARALRQLPPDKRFAAHGQIDLLVAATAALGPKVDDDRLWDPVLDLGRTLLTKAGMTGGRAPQSAPPTFESFVAYKKGYNPRSIRFDGVYKRNPAELTTGRIHDHFPEAVLAGCIEEPRSTGCSLILSCGPVSSGGFYQSFVLANGDVQGEFGATSSVIISDGDVTFVDPIRNCLIIARGNVTFRQIAWRSTIICGGKATIRRPAKEQRMEEEDIPVIKEKEPNPLGFITFFELARVGLEAKTASGAVAVATVKGGSAGEKAGLKVGDAVLDVNGKKPTDAESLRRLLRDALAVGDATVKLKRGNETVTVKLSLPE